jgi:2-iminobutanoate/2-iminopropanoate deaminase
VWQHIVDALHAADMGVGNLVKVTTFLADRRYAEANSAVRRAVLGDHRPALTVIVAEIFDPAWLVEIEAIAAG